MEDTGYPKSDIGSFANLASTYAEKLTSTVLPNMQVNMSDLFSNLEQAMESEEPMARITSSLMDSQCAACLCAFEVPSGLDADTKVACDPIKASLDVIKERNASIQKISFMATKAVLIVQAFEVHEVIRDTGKVLSLYSELDDGKSVFDATTQKAYLAFSNAFSCATVAREQAEIVRKSLAESCGLLVGAVTSDSMDGLASVRQHSKALASAAHKLRQLAPWLATANADDCNIEFVTSIAHTFQNFRVVALDAKEFQGTFDEQVTFIQAAMGHRYREVVVAVQLILSYGRALAIAKFNWALDDASKDSMLTGNLAEAAWTWTKSAGAKLDKLKEIAVKGSQDALTSDSAKLEEAAAALLPESPEKIAQDVKERTARIVETLNVAEDAFRDAGLPMHALDSARKVTGTATVKTVHWGLHQLSSASGADHIRTGEPCRKNIKIIMEFYGDILSKLPDDLISRCKELLKIDEREEVDGQQTTTADGPAKAAQGEREGGSKRQRSKTPEKEDDNDESEQSKAKGAKTAHSCGRGRGSGRRGGRGRAGGHASGAVPQDAIDG